MAQIDEIKQARLDKLTAVREKGWDPYVSKYEKVHSVSYALEHEGETVQTAGRIMSLRTHGNITFADLKDPTGRIQIFFKKDHIGDELFDDLKYLDIGDHIGVEGEVMKTTAGEISIMPTRYSLLTKSILPLPNEWFGLKDVETRYRKRYLDLIMNDDVRHIFELRSRVVTALRGYLDAQGFVEVETPALQPLYGGASAKPFITHYNALDADFYLRIAVELYLKRLIVGGYEKVYELGKNFRNEGFSRAHNPEFTMLEFYWAYADYEMLMDFSENLLNHVVQEVHGSLSVEFEGDTYDFTSPWERKTFRDLLRERLDLDIDEIDTEEKLIPLVKEKGWLDDLPAGYGFILDEVYKKHVRPGLKGPLFITDYPVELKPLAKRTHHDLTKSAAFQLVVNGVEFINAYNELNDPIDQRARWEEDMKLAARGGEEFQVVDEDYIEALSYGMPPTAGWGMGVDRFVAFLANKHTIKDVILFPTLRPDEVPLAAVKSQSKNMPQQPTKGSSEKADLTITREQALEILNKNLETKNLISHCKAVGATMKALAKRLGGDPELWEIAGLLHDADWDQTRNNPEEHTAQTIEWIKAHGENNKELIETILTHNHHHNGFRSPESLMEWALYTCDELTGFIVAVALLRPDKKLSSVEVKSVLKRFPVTAFAKPVDREQIKLCEEKLGIPLDEFVSITLQAMQEIAEEIGL